MFHIYTLICENYGKKSIPRDQLYQNKEMKIADTVLWSLFMRDNEKYHAPYYRLERYSVLKTKCIGVVDPEGPEKI